ncbi:hypothetical protein RFI_12505, partial [Reticulomyxa filosa]
MQLIKCVEMILSINFNKSKLIYNTCNSSFVFCKCRAVAKKKNRSQTSSAKTHKKNWQEEFHKEFNERRDKQKWRQRMRTIDGVLKDYYKTLGVSKHADTKEIRSAYYEINRQCHPDSIVYQSEQKLKRPQDHIHREHAKKRLMDAQEAYYVLVNEQRRSEYAECFIKEKMLKQQDTGTLYKHMCTLY